MAGRMRVIMTVHGGSQGLLDCLEGLVQRNERSVREGAIPLLRPGEIKASPFPVWRDGVTAVADKIGSTGTLAAWRAGQERALGKPARVALVGGIPNVVYVDPRNEDVVSVCGMGGVAVSGSGLTTPPSGVPDEGRSVEHMLLTLDDDMALPVNEINTAIGRHNAGRIRKRGLPRLYDSGVRYEVEGSPELWRDAEETLAVGAEDCETLSAYRVGDLIVEGFDTAEVFCRLIKMPAKTMGGSDGGRLFHAVVRVRDPQTGKWVYDDPSVHVGRFVPGGGMKVPPSYLAFAKERRKKGLDL
jgi:hypothetical protein